MQEAYSAASDGGEGYLLSCSAARHASAQILARSETPLRRQRIPPCTHARSWQSYSRSKGSAVLVNEFLQCHRRTAADFLNQIIRPGEDTVLMIDGDLTQMLD